ncbi:MAG TPA: methyltransferase domain-containing protein, partial [Pyrinomonadaceae bacterium]|nr:methyltransferase domain-containing protein [Pyrinomonadaceae bacterium]
MRFKKIDGLDYKRGAEEYPNKLAPSDQHHLLTKPFYNLAYKHNRWSGDGLDADTHRHFCDFANMAMVLALPPGARILDVGCGSGWLCEYFARFGYNVTGIDISPALIEMARERLGKIPFGADHERALSYRFLTHDIEAAPLADTFDAVICYDSLHHFEDEHAVMKNLRAMMDQGSQLFLLEGERPPEGSETEEELRGVMRQYETLESPFTRKYLLELLRDHGFVVVGDYVSINGLFERDRVEGAPSFQPEVEAFNYLLCKKVSSVDEKAFDSRNPGRLTARFSIPGDYSATLRTGEKLIVPIEIENTGDTVWLVSRTALKGTVRLGVKILNNLAEVVYEEHGTPPLSRAVGPGEKISLRIAVSAPVTP